MLAPHLPSRAVLFVDQITIDKAQEAAITAKDGDKKPSLPDIIPGFKANSLDICEFLVSHSHLYDAPAFAPCTTSFKINKSQLSFVGVELSVAKGLSITLGSEQQAPPFQFTKGETFLC